MRKITKPISAIRRHMDTYQSKKISGNYPEAAVLVAICEQQGEWSVLLTRRAEHLSLHPGEAAFPGGMQDALDDSLLDTALREAHEEVGLDKNSVNNFGYLDQKVTRSGIKVTPCLGIIPIGVELIANTDELDFFYYVPLSHFIRPSCMQVERLEYEGRLCSVPRFEIIMEERGKQLIWGVTALIIVDLLNTVFNTAIRLDNVK